ncbi:AraC family transcriptional regulator [Paenibacillus sp. BIHB 4019]|nr:AraC family transcriptional regulator [Paenibacillus sp. BIHB 4019]
MNEKLSHYLCGKFISEGNWSHMKRNALHYEIIMMLEGQMYIAEEEREYVVRPGDMLLLRPGMTHFGYRNSESPVSFYWVHYGTKAEQYRSYPTHVPIDGPSTINQLFKQLLHVSSFSAEEANAALLLLLNELTRTIDQQNHAPHAIVNNICRWIEAHLHLDINVRKIAEVFNFNKDYISKVVKREKGMGIKAYILTQRISRAKLKLLNTNLSVKEIAGECGFSDYKLFLRTFKHYEGMTPSDYRNILYSTPLNI